MVRGSKRSDSNTRSSEDRIKLVLELASKKGGEVSVKECVCAELGVHDFLTADTGSDTQRSYQLYRNTFNDLIKGGKVIKNRYTTQIRIPLR